MRLDGKADRKAQNASPNKTFAKKTPDGDAAKTDRNSCRIAGHREYFAVGQKEANHESGEDGRILRTEIPDQNRGQKNACKDKKQPQEVCRPPRQQRKGNRHDERRRRVDILRSDLASRRCIRRVAFRFVDVFHVACLVGIVMLQQAAGRIIESPEVRQRNRNGIFEHGAQHDKYQAAQQKHRETIAPLSCHPEPLNLFSRSGLKGSCRHSGLQSYT